MFRGPGYNAASTTRNAPTPTKVLFQEVAGEALTDRPGSGPGFRFPRGRRVLGRGGAVARADGEWDSTLPRPGSSIRLLPWPTSDEAQVDALIEAVRSAVARLAENGAGARACVN